MPASRRLYEELAATVKRQLASYASNSAEAQAVAALVRALSADLKTDNCHLRYDRFYAACGLDEWGHVKPADGTWTFFGRWDDGSIVVDFVLPGVVKDTRPENGDNLWSDSASGPDVETAQRAIVAQYEKEEDGD